MLNAVRDEIWRRRQGWAAAQAERRHRKGQTGLYAQFVSPGDRVFDVGANVGDRVRTFVELGADVVAFEPQPDLAERLRHTWPQVAVREVALGERTGKAVLSLAKESTISSMSSHWREAVVASGRFADKQWPESIMVDVSTLDLEVAALGVPRFCKIDVEGFEASVLKGLSTPVPALSFEYTAEVGDVARECLEHLAGLGEYRFAFSPGETMQLWGSGWCDLETAWAALRSLRGPLPWGDVYARTAGS